MKNENLKTLLQQQKELRIKINKIQEKEERKREKEMEKLVGCCVKGEYYDFAFRKILDYCYSKNYGIYFIMEEIN